MKTSITYHRVKTTEELKAILKLQEENLRHSISEEQKVKEGFVTLEHDFDILKKMNESCAHCIAKNNDKVVGYALSMLQYFKRDIPLLIPMFNEIDKVIKEQSRSSNYIVMGQVCVDKSVRGKGVFRGLYNYMAEELKSNFDAIITEVDTKNKRSLNAHKAVGFETLKKYSSNNQLWEIISLRI
ncbi:GNAT family N-acetyltransferase [uncultured Lacinutrix sp.]|uniref:GNAT family N-acetyltransferase n=1 Tax=uncultured Lacinutrix sp. TaxID=574032 RepID=UPI0026389FD4|nr:GNAT family N-acetyltransferase [uncultured Lacinutrix sp.]